MDNVPLTTGAWITLRVTHNSTAPATMKGFISDRKMQEYFLHEERNEEERVGAAQTAKTVEHRCCAGIIGNLLFVLSGGHRPARYTGSYGITPSSPRGGKTLLGLRHVSKAGSRPVGVAAVSIAVRHGSPSATAWTPRRRRQ